MFDEPFRIGPTSAMAKALDSQSFVPGSRPNSGSTYMHCWWFLTRMTWLDSVFMISNGKSDVVNIRLHDESFENLYKIVHYCKLKNNGIKWNWVTFGYRVRHRITTSARFVVRISVATSNPFCTFDFAWCKQRFLPFSICLSISKILRLAYGLEVCLLCQKVNFKMNEPRHWPKQVKHTGIPRPKRLHWPVPQHRANLQRWRSQFDIWWRPHLLRIHLPHCLICD